MMWVPPKVSQELQDAAMEQLAEVQRVFLSQELEFYNRELREIDPLLEVGWVPEHADVPGTVPGRFHLVRWNEPPVPPTLEPLEDDGEFISLGAWIFDRVRHMDLWNDQVRRERKRRLQNLEQSKRRAKMHEREEIAEEFSDRCKAAFNPGVSMTSAGPWKARAGARSDRQRAV